ncbi:ABC transporter permease, partial [Achromobacter xylosoxidans]
MIARNLIRLVALGVLAYLALPLVVILGSSFTSTPYLAFPPKGFTLEWYRTLLIEAGYVAAFTTSTVL